MAKKTVAAKKRVVKIDGVGQLHVMSSFNNVIVTLANGDGQVISWSSAGKQGFRRRMAHAMHHAYHRRKHQY